MTTSKFPVSLHENSIKEAVEVTNEGAKMYSLEYTELKKAFFTSYHWR
jgi:hypothetical protein